MRDVRRQIEVRVNDKFRKYTPDDWFYEGVVTDVNQTDGYADIDFGDWVQRYPLLALREYFPDDGTFEKCLVTQVTGEMIADYRVEA